MAFLVLAGMAIILLGVALITKFLLIPIGELWKPAVIGALITLAIIAVLGFIAYKLIDFVKGGGEDKDGKKREAVTWKDLAKAGAILLGMAVILLVIALITKELLVPIGAAGWDGAIGAGIVLLTIAGLGYIAYMLIDWVQGGGEDKDGKKREPIKVKDIGKAALILADLISAL